MSLPLVTSDDCARLEEVVREGPTLCCSDDITVQLADGFVPMGKNLPLLQRHIICQQTGQAFKGKMWIRKENTKEKEEQKQKEKE